MYNICCNSYIILEREGYEIYCVQSKNVWTLKLQGVLRKSTIPVLHEVRLYVHSFNLAKNYILN